MIFQARMRVADGLMRLAWWVQPAYQSRCRVAPDGQSITFWREPTAPKG